MNSKLLQWVGTAAIALLVGGSLAALAVVRSRLSITVASEESGAKRGPDPIALLTEDVRDAMRGQATLAKAQEQSLGQLATALEKALGELDASNRDEARKLAAEVGLIRAEIAAQRAEFAKEIAAERMAIERLAGVVAEEAASRASAPRVAAAPAAAEAPPAPEPSVAAAAPVPEAPPATKPAPSPARKGFLTFQVAADGFAFDKPQRFTVLDSLSRVGFDAKSTLHDFSGATSKVRGEITACLARPAEGCAGAIVADSAALQTGLDDRDEEMRKVLDTAKHPTIRFEWVSFDAESVDPKERKVAGTARGTMTIRGVSREIAMPVTVAVDASRRLAIDGQAKIKLTDYQVPVPSKLGLISMDDEVVLWVAIRARSLGAAEKGSAGGK